jgi:hypothetical protein
MRGKGKSYVGGGYAGYGQAAVDIGTFGDLAYTSTSLFNRIAREYGSSSRFPESVGMITLPRGTQAGYVDAVLDKGESELLLPRYARVRIDKAYREGGVYCIEGQLVRR